MNGLETITTLTRRLGISTRTLRYYEQIGLISSRRVEGYAYRVYDAQTCRRMEQILVLRALRIPLRQIGALLSYPETARAVEVFSKQAEELDAQITSLSTIRDILLRLMDALREKTCLRLTPELLEDERLLRAVAPFMRTDKKEENVMENLRDAGKTLDKLTDRDVRIVYLPPATVAAYRYVGDEPEAHVSEVIDGFVRAHDLVRVKPDIRHYGFNAPNPVDETNFHGYEMWVTIPEDMDVPAPLEKKRFEGGLYAAKMIPMGAFEVWRRLAEWAGSSEKYEYRGDWNGENMFGWMEESLNYVTNVKLGNSEPEDLQLDLLLPIRKKAEGAGR